MKRARGKNFSLWKTCQVPSSLLSGDPCPALGRLRSVLLSCAPTTTITRQKVTIAREFVLITRNELFTSYQAVEWNPPQQCNRMHRTSLSIILNSGRKPQFIIWFMTSRRLNDFEAYLFLQLIDFLGNLVPLSNNLYLFLFQLSSEPDVINRIAFLKKYFNTTRRNTKEI